jgi:hypothetical protein
VQKFCQLLLFLGTLGRAWFIVLVESELLDSLSGLGPLQESFTSDIVAFRLIDMIQHCHGSCVDEAASTILTPRCQREIKRV